MFSSVRTVILVVALIVSLGLNIAIVTVQSIAMAVSSTVGAVAGVSAVLPQFRVVKANGERKFLTEAVRSTSERIAKRTASGATRNLASVFGEAVPTIGIGVIAGATAWELKDACDTMRDLHDLDVALDPANANPVDATEVCGLKVPTKEEIWDMVKASPGAAWELAKDAMPELPEMPEWTLPEMPEVDWKFWE